MEVQRKIAELCYLSIVGKKTAESLVQRMNCKKTKKNSWNMLYFKPHLPYPQVRHDRKPRSTQCSLMYWQDVGSQIIKTKSNLFSASVKPEKDEDVKCAGDTGRGNIVRQGLPDLKPVEIWTDTLWETSARVLSAKQETAKSLA